MGASHANAVIAVDDGFFRPRDKGILGEVKEAVK
jgi:hypothetical protein